MADDVNTPHEVIKHVKCVSTVCIAALR